MKNPRSANKNPEKPGSNFSGIGDNCSKTQPFPENPTFFKKIYVLST